MQVFENKNILIKTYMHESGLYYLGKSLERHLKLFGNNVSFMAKSRYKRSNNLFVRQYEMPRTSLSKDNFFIPNNKATIESQIIPYIKKNNIDVIISLETFMRKSSWIKKVKSSTNVSVVDVPMSEWVTESFVKNNSYRIFDEIWCLTNTAYDIFKKYNSAKMVEWNYVDDSLFVDRKDRAGRLTFYHQASLNANFSQKNTKMVIDAFLKANKTLEDMTLIVSGNLSPRDYAAAEKCKNIILIKEFVDRGDIASIYSKAHCVICPSTREGLGLSFYEAKASGCKIITTDTDPMNIHTDYLCKVIAYNNSGSMVKHAITSADEIFNQIKIVYEEFNMSETKKKSREEIDKENEALMDAFKAGSEEPVQSKTDPEPELDSSKLDALKAKMKIKKEQDMDVVSSRSVAIEMAVIGVGQAGSRIAEIFHKKGYDVGVVNTSEQDLEFIEVLPNQKLLLEGSLGGTGKDLDLGREIFEENVDSLIPFIDTVIDGNNMVYLAVSGGGGTGSSSVETLVPTLFETGLPVGVIYVLPKATEDAKSKRNSIETLSRLARMTADNMVSNLIVVDNARIEQIYADLSQSKFWEASNNAIVEPLHIFNSLTAKPSRFTSLDPSDFGKIISCGDCSTYGVMEVADYMEETALAEAVIESLSSNMLASGFDLSQTRAGGVIITGPKETLEKIPAININYCFHMISEQTNGASIFQGVYDVDSDSDAVKIYSWFAGLGLPKDRIDNLKRESKQQEEVASAKERNRTAAMTLDLEEDKVSSMAGEINRKIQKKKSGFNKLQRGGRSRSSLIDRRKRR